jgi:hypothetical protein
MFLQSSGILALPWPPWKPLTQSILIIFDDCRAHEGPFTTNAERTGVLNKLWLLTTYEYPDLDVPLKNSCVISFSHGLEP